MEQDQTELEPEILEAYRGLSTPVSAPPDVLARVERRITRRRTARRGMVAVAALAVVGGVGTQVLGDGDGSDGGRQVASDPGSGAVSSLTFTRTDGSTYSFDAADLAVSCPAPGPEGRQHLLLTRPDDAQPVLYVDLQVDKVAPGQVFDLPYDVNGGTEKLPMIFFFTDSVGDDANEVGSNMAGSTGTVTVHDASCGPSPSLWVEIDGSLGSEVEQPALAITGEYHS